MVLEGIGRFKYPKRGKTGLIFVPAAITQDSAFTIKEGAVRIKIEGKKLIIESLES